MNSKLNKETLSKLSTQIQNYILAIESENEARDKQRFHLYKQIDNYKNDLDNLQRKVKATETYCQSIKENYQKFFNENKALKEQINSKMLTILQSQHVIVNLQTTISQLNLRFHHLASEIPLLFEPYMPINHKMKQLKVLNTHNASNCITEPVNFQQVENHLKQVIVQKLKVLQQKQNQINLQNNQMKNSQVEELYCFLDKFNNSDINLIKDMFQTLQQQILQIKKLKDQNCRLKDQILLSFDRFTKSNQIATSIQKIGADKNYQGIRQQTNYTLNDTSFDSEDLRQKLGIERHI